MLGCLVVGCCFRRGRVWGRRVGRRLSATWNVGRRVLVPDLRNPLPNATYTVDGMFHYTTDAWSRTVRLEVDLLGDVAERFRSRSDSLQVHVKDYGNELASEYDMKFNRGILSEQGPGVLGGDQYSHHAGGIQPVSRR